MKRLMLAATTIIAAGCSSTQPQRTSQNPPPENAPAERESDFVGARGPDGPTGARGAQGATGQTGEAGHASAGARGPAGEAGAMGAQGPAGAQGRAGDLAVGPAGAAGPAGATGEQGPAGATGARGASGDGHAGPAGPTGRTGAQGAAGDTGAQGPALTGPAGPAGRAGAAGEQGERGQTGAQGATMDGVAGEAGEAGATGAAGPVGPTGPVGPAGVIERWMSYRDFWFDADLAVIHDADADQVAEIAAYLNENPSLVLGIDGSTNPRATEQGDKDLNDRRVEAVRDSLVDAGVSADRITDGMFGDVNLRRDGRVEVLIRTDQRSAAEIEQAGLTGTSGAARATSARGTDMTTDDSQADAAEVWTCYREFWFDDGATDIHPADASKVMAIAAYIKENPSMHIGIDSSSNPDGNDGTDLSLARRRGTALRTALVEAGVPASSIKTGSFGDAELWRDGRVAVLVNTDELSPADRHSATPTGEWTCYQELWFDSDTAEIHHCDLSKVTEMAAYLKANPSVQFGIDSSLSAESDDQADLDLAERRGDAVREALIAAGVPAASIESGELGDVDFRRDGRVEVLIKTERSPQGQ